MDIAVRDTFVALWEKYFDGAELPICLFYTDEPPGGKPLARPAGHVCVMGKLSRARKGDVLCFGADSFGCFGGKRYMGFTNETMPNFEHFLSCGIPGKLEGERYKKSPEIVLDVMANQPHFEAPAEYVVFKRWDRLEPSDAPEVVIFFAPPDVLAGLFTLSGFDRSEPDTVIAPFGAGCATIVQQPYLEGLSERPRSIVGMFDVSARPFVQADVLSFAVPMARFVQMIENMEESFLITPSWAKVRRRIERRPAGKAPPTSDAQPDDG